MLILPLAAMAQGELYKRYASRPELKVAQVSGFKLCDTVRVDVVLLQADNEKVWQQMVKEFNIAGNDGVTSWLGDTKQPANRVKWTGRPILRVVASHKKQTIGLYLLNNETQYDALMDYQLNAMSKKNTK